MTTKYQFPDLDSLTLNDLYVIKARTGVDIFNPQTTSHKNVAILWWASQDTDEPLKWADLQGMTARQLVDLLSTAWDDDTETDAAEAPVEPPVVDGETPKASPTSTSSGSPEPSVSDPQTSAPASSES